MSLTVAPARLRDLRARVGLKQAEVARRLGIDGSLVSGWESGQRVVPIERLVPLALALECDYDELVGSAPPPPGEEFAALQPVYTLDTRKPSEPRVAPVARETEANPTPRKRYVVVYQSGDMGRSPICARCSRWRCRGLGHA